ncbi:hypothetical protein I5V54_04550 [Stenotrophomonas maltophilia]|nr:hypothetical protein [Stenotrophomonas maltophilia]MBH1843011.1 hypothetical protein [Stenotrophomonas maltophilia]
MDETVYDAAWRAYKAAPRAVANGPSRSAVRAAVDAALAARQPVGQIVGYMDPDAEFLLPRADGCVLMGKVEVCLWQTPGGKYTKPLYDAPAQSVNLEKLRLLGERIEQVGKNAAPTAMGSGNVYFRNVIDWGRELLAMIDSHPEVPDAP